MRESRLALALQRHLPGIVLILCLIQPVMDVLSYWLIYAEAGNTITLLLRFCVLIVLVLCGFVLSERKWIYLTLAGVLLLMTVGHVAVCIRYGYDAPVADLTNLVRIYQLPLATLVFVTFLKKDRRCLTALELGFLCNLGIILLVGLLATVTGTDPHTYANKGVGMLGWFTMPSAQSAILSMLVPVSVVFVMERKKLRPVYVAGIGVVGFGMLYLFATRLSYAALLGCAFCLAGVCLLLKWQKKVPAGRAAAILAAFGIVAVLLAGVSPMEANNEKVAVNAELKQQDIDTMVASDRAAAEAEGLTGRELELAALRSAYDKYLPGVTGRFGLERVAEHYGFSTDMNEICNARLQKRAYCTFLMEDQPLARIFGLELSDMTFDSATYDAENDLHGIYFLCGWVGLALLLATLVFLFLCVLWALLRDFKGFVTLENAGFGIAMVCGLAHAYFTAGVLRRPNSNIYLAAIAAVLYCAAEAGQKKTRREVEL